MIRPYVEEQLRKCTFADLSNYDTTTNTFIIPKYAKPHYELNKCYLVQLPAHMINNSASVVMVNWNKGIPPRAEYLKIFVSKTMGKMIFVDSLSYDMINRRDGTDMWSGWLPIEEIKYIAAL